MDLKRPEIKQWTASFSYNSNGSGIAMTYLAQALRTNLMAVVSGRTAAELALMNKSLRDSELTKANGYRR